MYYSVGIVVPALRTTFVVPVVAVIALTSLLKLRGHRSVRVAEPVPNIDVGAVAAGNRVSAAAIVTLMLVLSGGLILRRQIAVRVAEGRRVRSHPSRGRTADGGRALRIARVGPMAAQRVPA